jgi:Anti-sigma-K factor rskA
LTPDFEDLVGTDLPPQERERLLRAHELLLAAGPPPELPPALAEPRVPQADIVKPFFGRRRNTTVALLAAAVAAAAFGIGYLTGHQGTGSGFPTRRTVVMHGTPAAPAGAVASIALGGRDDAGNWEMLVRASNLRKLPRGAYYTLWLTRKGRPVAPCGSFVAGGASTTEVRFTVAYKLKRYDGWVVTTQMRGDHEPGRVLLRTVKV